VGTDRAAGTGRPDEHGEHGVFHRLVRRLQQWSTGAYEVVPGLRRAIEDLIRVEILDRALLVAAQSLFAMAPLLVVMAAFSPEGARDRVLDQIADVMALQGTGLDPVQRTVRSEQVRTQTGLIGIVVVLVSATSFARTLQRLYERVWERSHIGGVPGIRRSLEWIIGCLAYLQVLALVLSSLSTLPGASLWRLLGQVVAGTLLWWWTARMLLLGREPWVNLLPGAMLTGVGMAVLTTTSKVAMPAYVEANVAQFGLLGLLFAASTWLLVFGCIIVVAAVLGRVAVIEPRFSHWYQRLHGIWTHRRDGEITRPG
jgi:membrane protein